MDLLCRDAQLSISPASPNPGFAFGVSRLPKVLHTTSYLAKVHDVELPMLDNILQPNRITWT